MRATIRRELGSLSLQTVLTVLVTVLTVLLTVLTVLAVLVTVLTVLCLQVRACGAHAAARL